MHSNPAQRNHRVSASTRRDLSSQLKPSTGVRCHFTIQLWRYHASAVNTPVTECTSYGWPLAFQILFNSSQFQLLNLLIRSSNLPVPPPESPSSHHGRWETRKKERKPYVTQGPIEQIKETFNLANPRRYSSPLARGHGIGVRLIYNEHAARYSFFAARISFKSTLTKSHPELDPGTGYGYQRQSHQEIFDHVAIICSPSTPKTFFGSRIARSIFPITTKV